MRGARRLTYADPHMRNLLLALLHLAVVTAKLCGSGGVRAVMAENLLQAYYNAARCHASLEGYTPMTFASGHALPPADLHNVRWVSHCRDLVQLPVAA